VVAAVLCAATAASAQPAPSLGLHVGEGTLHFFLEGDGHYDSLVGYLPGATGGTLVPTSDIIVHVRPGLKFDLLTSATSFNFNGSAEYLYYTRALSSSTGGLSRFQANVSADAAFNRDGAVEVQLSDALSRSDRTQNPAVAVGVLSLYNNVRLAAPIHPGGRALEITPSVAWGIEFFDCLAPSTSAAVGQCVNATVRGFNYSNVGLGLNAKWKFFPKTALVVDVANDIRTYFDPAGGNTAATIFRAQAGLMGLISTYFNVTLLAGYVHDFGISNLNNVIGQAEVGYSPTEMIRLTAGYLRTALPVPGLTNYIDDRPYLRATVGLWAGRLTLNAGASLDLLHYSAGRNDWVVAGNAGATVVVFSWMDVGALYGLGVRGSSDTAPGLNTTRHEVTLRLGVHY
jgi:hypothetical protein